MEKYLLWFKAHERLLIIALVLAVGAFGFIKWLDHDAAVKHDQMIVAQQTLAQTDANNAKLTAQLNAQQVQYNELLLAMNQEISDLKVSIEKRDAATAGKVAEVIKPKTSSQAVDDLNAAYKLPAPVTVTVTGAEVPTVDLQQFTVAKIEGDAAKADLTDTQKQLTDTQAELTSAQGVVVTQTKVIDGLNDARKKDDAAHNDEVKSLKADARKSKRNWFIAGVIAGWTGRSLLKSAAGL